MKRQKNKEELRKYCKDNEERISRMDASAYDMICIMLNREDLLEKKTKYLKEESVNMICVRLWKTGQRSVEMREERVCWS